MLPNGKCACSEDDCKDSGADYATNSLGHMADAELLRWRIQELAGVTLAKPSIDAMSSRKTTNAETPNGVARD